MNKPRTINALSEWPTWLVIFTVYLLWGFILNNFESIPMAPVFLVIVLAFHGSVQHELLHGHPSDNQTVNDCLAYPPLALWYPYPIYKSLHLKHHENEHLTIPGVDPESYFVSEARWNEQSKWRQKLSVFNMTLLGRLLLAPLLHFLGLKRQMIRSLKTSNSKDTLIWIFHESIVLFLLLLIGLFFEVNIFIYIACAYFAQSLTLLRSFYEHRVTSEPGYRSIIMKASIPMRILYLNNNYHAIHHQHPDMSWFKLGKEYNSNPEYHEEQNNHFIERGYWQWFSKFAFRSVTSPVHPGFAKND
jgi:fatty acid desaturase